MVAQLRGCGRLAIFIFIDKFLGVFEVFVIQPCVLMIFKTQPFD